MPEDYQEIVPLTDPVVEDISKSKPLPVHPPESSASGVKQVLPEQNLGAAATPPKPSKNLIAIPLIILALLAVTAASLFYFQNQQLKSQIQDLANTIESQKTLPVVPVPEKGQTLRPAAEIATASGLQSPVPTSLVQQALSLAQQKYPDAQLILITSDNPHLPDQTVSKYWFRQSSNTKKYLYVSFIANESSLVDQQIYVSPDNNIPSLNQRLTENKLGITLAQAISLANSLCQDPEKCQQATAVKAQFLDSGTTLIWQVTYQIPDQQQPLVFQINSLTQELIYQSQK